MVREEYIQWNRPFSFMRTNYSISHHSVLELTEIAFRNIMVGFYPAVLLVRIAFPLSCQKGLQQTVERQVQHGDLREQVVVEARGIGSEVETGEEPQEVRFHGQGLEVWKQIVEHEAGHQLVLLLAAEAQQLRRHAHHETMRHGLNWSLAACCLLTCRTVETLRMESVAVLRRSVVEVGLHGVDRKVEIDRRKGRLDEELQHRKTGVHQSTKLAFFSLESVIKRYSSDSPVS